MVEPIVGQGAASAGTAAELTIELWIDEWVRYEGTAEQLCSEGLIPDGFEWPQAAASSRWEANGFSYWLSRTRPAGHKGPMRSWLTLDNWSLRVRVEGRDHYWQVRRQLERKAAELRAEVYRHSPAGSREWYAHYRRFRATVDDRAFQEFKALVPGLIPPKRGRKPKAAQ